MGFTDKDKWVVVCVTPIGESIEGEYSTQAEALQMQIALKLNNPQGVYDVKTKKGLQYVKENDMKDPKICGDSININGVYICRLECLPCSLIEGCAKGKAEALVDALIKSIKGE